MKVLKTYNEVVSRPNTKLSLRKIQLDSGSIVIDFRILYRQNGKWLHTKKGVMVYPEFANEFFKKEFKIS